MTNRSRQSASSVAVLPYLYVALFLLAFGPLGSGSYIFMHATVVALVCGLAWPIYRSAARDASKAPMLMFAGVYCLFHIGLAIVYLIDDELLFTTFGPVLRWYSDEVFVRRAYLVVVLFFFGLSASLSFRASEVGVETSSRIADQPFMADRSSYIAVGLLAVAEALWLGIVIFATGTENYIEYNETFRGGNAGILAGVLVFLYPTISALFFFACVRSRGLRLPFVVFGAWAIISFPLGLRGRVLFPLAMTIAALHAQGRVRLRAPSVLIGSYITLVLISIVRLARGSQTITESLAGASGLSALAELGSSLRPVFEVQRWITEGVDQYRLGETYYAPVQRAIEGLLPFADRIPAQLDMRLMNVAIVRNAGGNYGFSIAAEAFINFGYVGCVLIGFFVGRFLITYGRELSRGKTSVLASAVVYALFYHIRNSFVGTFGSFFMFAIVGLAITFFAGRHRGGSGTHLHQMDVLN